MLRLHLFHSRNPLVLKRGLALSPFSMNCSSRKPPVDNDKRRSGVSKNNLRTGANHPIFSHPKGSFKIADKEASNVYVNTNRKPLTLQPYDNVYRLPNREKRKIREGQTSERVVFQIIGNGAAGSCNSLLLSCGNRNYLFNCGENIVRMGREHGLSVYDIQDIFVTSRKWKNIGGLITLCLTACAEGVSDVSIHGPNDLLKIFEATRSFILLPGLKVLGLFAEDHVHEDNEVIISHVPLQTTSKPWFSTKPVYSNWLQDSYAPSLKKNSEELNWAAIKKLQSEPIDQTVKAYVVKIKDYCKKTFNLQKALDLGIPRGSEMSMLQRGEDLYIDKNTVIKASDFLEDTHSGGPKEYIVIECPSKFYLQSLMSEPRLSNNSLPHLAGIFHFSPPEVMAHEKYIRWMNQFPATTRHIVCNENSVGYGLREALSHNGVLHCISPEIFPSWIEVQQKELERVKPDYSQITSGVVEQAQSGQKCIVRTNHKEDESDDAVFEAVTKEEVAASIAFAAEFLEGEYVKIRRCVDEAGQRYPRITFLGTGSTMQSALRNVSSILLETHPDNFILMDCGDGTLSQLHRHFGREGSLHVLRNLKAIFISHMHADHHIGLISLLVEYERSFSDARRPSTKMTLIAPNIITQFLTPYHYKFQTILTNICQVMGQQLLNTVESNEEDRLSVNTIRLESICNDLSVRDIRTCYANHCHDAFCISITTNEGYKVVYSGDTQPTQSLVDLCHKDQVPDLLIHEATLAHVYKKSCAEKRHSTFTEAVEEARASRAKFTIMTHFSQRYPHLPPLGEFEVDDRVAVAFDGMSVCPDTLPCTRAIFPALKKVFHQRLSHSDKIDKLKSDGDFKHFAKKITANFSGSDL